MNSAQIFFADLAWDLKKAGNSHLANSLRHLSADDAYKLLEYILDTAPEES